VRRSRRGAEASPKTSPASPYSSASPTSDFTTGAGVPVDAGFSAIGLCLHLPGTAGRLASSPVMRERAFEFKFERAHSCGLGRLAFEPRSPDVHHLKPPALVSQFRPGAVATTGRSRRCDCIRRRPILRSLWASLPYYVGPQDAASEISLGIDDLSESCCAWQGVFSAAIAARMIGSCLQQDEEER
jgi:hypothetical protein